MTTPSSHSSETNSLIGLEVEDSPTSVTAPTGRDSPVAPATFLIPESFSDVPHHLIATTEYLISGAHAIGATAEHLLVTFKRFITACTTTPSPIPAVPASAPSPVAAVPAPAPSPIPAVPASAPSPVAAVPAPAPSPIPAVPASAPSPVPAVPAPAPSPIPAVPASAPSPVPAVPAPAPSPVPAAAAVPGGLGAKRQRVELLNTNKIVPTAAGLEGGRGPDERPAKRRQLQTIKTSSYEEHGGN